MDHDATITRSLPTARRRGLEDLHGSEVFAVLASFVVILFGLLSA